MFALNRTLSQQESIRWGLSTTPYSTDDLIKHYNCGDLDRVMFSHDTTQIPYLVNSSLSAPELVLAKHIDSYFQEELIDKRNARMANRVAQLITDNPSRSFFFAFGAGLYIYIK